MLTQLDFSLNTIKSTIETKQNTNSVSTSLIKDVSNNITIGLSDFIGVSPLNASNTISLKYDSAQFNIDVVVI